MRPEPGSLKVARGNIAREEPTMVESVETFQLSLDAAEAYEATFVPALFGEWAPHLVDAAGIRPGQSVLDVACGTGVVARARLTGSPAQGRWWASI